MKQNHFVLIAVIAAALFQVSAQAFAQNPGTASSALSTIQTLPELGKWLEKNPPAVYPINNPATAQQELTVALANLRQNANHLINYLRQNGEIGQKWAKVLNTEGLRATLSQAEPNLEELEKIHEKFHSHQWGLEITEIRRVADGLNDYVLLRMIVADNIDPSDGVKQAAARLIRVLKASDKPSFESVSELNEVLTWLKQYRQMPNVCQAIERISSKSNFFAQLSDKFVLKFLNAPIDQTEQVQEYIVGTPQRGWVRTVGRTSGAFNPDPSRINLSISVNALSGGNMVAQTGNVAVSSVSNNSIYVIKDIFFDGRQFLTTPARSAAQVNSQITGVDSPGGLVQLIATNRANDMKPQAEAEAAYKARVRAETAMNNTVTKMLINTNTRFTQFSELYRARGLFPHPFICSTTKNQLQFQGLIKDNHPLLINSAVPKAPQNADIYMAIHQTALMEVAKTMLSDIKADRTVFLSMAQSMMPTSAFKKLRENVRKNDAKARAEKREIQSGYVYFNSDYPASVQFTGNTIQIAVRMEAFQGKGDKSIQEIPMNLTVAYKIEGIVKDGIRFVRVGNAELLPRDFETGKRKLTTQETTIRNRLADDLQAAFPDDFVVKSGAISEMIRNDSPLKSTMTGQLKPVLAKAENGWLTLAWQVVE